MTGKGGARHWLRLLRAVLWLLLPLQAIFSIDKSNPFNNAHVSSSAVALGPGGSASTTHHAPPLIAPAAPAAGPSAQPGTNHLARIEQMFHALLDQVGAEPICTDPKPQYEPPPTPPQPPSRSSWSVTWVSTPLDTTSGATFVGLGSQFGHVVPREEMISFVNDRIAESEARSTAALRSVEERLSRAVQALEQQLAERQGPTEEVDFF